MPGNFRIKKKNRFPYDDYNADLQAPSGCIYFTRVTKYLQRVSPIYMEKYFLNVKIQNV